MLTTCASKHNRLWRQRPLPQRLLDYAAADVRFLLPLVDVLADQLVKTFAAKLSTLQARASIADQQAPGGTSGTALKVGQRYRLTIDGRGVPTYEKAASALAAELASAGGSGAGETGSAAVSGAAEEEAAAESGAAVDTAIDGGAESDEDGAAAGDSSAAAGGEEDEGVATLLPLLPPR